MTSQPSLSSIAPEVMECIVTLLDLPDISSLRLVARDVCEKASTDMFKSHFRRKRVKLTPEQLQRAISVTQQHRYGCLLEHLTLVGIPSFLSQDLQTTAYQQNIARLLRQALETICLNSARGCLPAICLIIDGAGKGDSLHLKNWDKRWSIWEAAAECFEMTMLAIGSSQLSIEVLDIFDSVKRCSLACDQVSPILAKINLADSLRNLKQLSMSLSFHERRRPEPEHMESTAFGTENVAAICRFLQLCPHLEDLKLHFYGTYSISCAGGLTHALRAELLFFNQVSESCQFPCLGRLSLNGIYTSEAALLSFLRQAQLRSLDMNEIHLQGTYRPIFDHLVEHMNQLEYVHLNDLFEANLINFNAPGKPHFPTLGRRGNGPNEITRIGTDARKPIDYQLKSGRPLGSPLIHNWIERRVSKYGPIVPYYPASAPLFIYE
ncbi:uncharacterized protein PAC_14667 [Phialocephala subalpina]|uniref:F-box domain-containing protein n=1 Tax=Phialocephala subalpina TaxID=576137 RepID=A0A1L7XIC5_9HELO|nr:uncharacterized protein PAC_14667 [Phialocephala subalpina]